MQEELTRERLMNEDLEKRLEETVGNRKKS